MCFKLWRWYIVYWFFSCCYPGLLFRLSFLAYCLYNTVSYPYQAVICPHCSTSYSYIKCNAWASSYIKAARYLYYIIICSLGIASFSILRAIRYTYAHWCRFIITLRASYIDELLHPLQPPPSLQFYHILSPTLPNFISACKHLTTIFVRLMPQDNSGGTL